MKRLLLAVLVLSCAASARAQDPNYGSGFASTGLTLNGGAAISGTKLVLTDGGTGEARSAFFSTPVNISGFTNTFTFQDQNASADGLCFVIEASGPTAVGGGGGSLGYAGTTGPLSTKSLCVSFDLYNNKTFSEISNSGLFTNGASPAGGAGSSTGLSFQSGDTFSVTMNYSGTTLAMTITDTVTNARYSTSFTVNIPTLVGSNTAYVGFTGGTGGLAAIQDILTWTFTPAGPAAPTITTQPTNQTVVVGQTATFSVVASGNPAPTYQWLLNNGSGFNPISGATSASYTTPATTNANNGETFEVTITNTQGSITSNVVTLTVTTSPTAPSYGGGFTSTGLTLNGGATISGTKLVLADGGTGEARSAFFNTPVNIDSFTTTFTFQLPSSNADGITITIQNNTSTALGGGGGNLGYGPTSGTSGGIANSVALGFQLYNRSTGEVNLVGLWTNGQSPASSPGTDMSGSGINLHSGDTFSVTMNYNGSTLTMQITDTVTNATYSTSFTVNIASIVGGNNAYVGFTGADGGLTSIQDILTWTFTPTGGSPTPPTIVTQPSSQTVNAGQTATFTVVANGSPAPTYQWLENTGSGFTDISGATSASYTTPATTSANNGTTFEVIITNSQGSVTSNVVTLTVNVVAPSITTQPTNQTVIVGQTATFTVVASGSAPLSYQWLQNTGSGFSNISGATSASYTTPATTSANNGTTFEVTVTNSKGSVTSNVVTLTVTTSQSNPSYASGFTSSGLMLNGGSSISGSSLELSDGGFGEARSAFFTTAVNVQAFTNTFTFQDTSAQADGFCFVIEASGPTAVGTGGGDLGYAGTSSPFNSDSLCVDFDLYNGATQMEISNSGLFTNGAVPAHGAGSSTGLSFQSGDTFSVSMNYNGTTLSMTIKDTVTKATYTTSFTVNIPGIVGGNTAYVGFTAGTGGLSAIQKILTWTFTPTTVTPSAPQITTQPTNQTVVVGQTATFTVAATGNPTPTYQWLSNTGSGFTNISGATSATYTTPATASGNNGETFEVTVSNSQGSVTSNIVTLTVTAASSTPNYSSGFSSAGLQLNGGATITGGASLQLTDGGLGEGRSTFFTTPVNVGAFVATFTFQMTNASADGFTFTIQNNSPTALGGSGGSLGYGPTSGTTGGIPNSVALGFQMYSSGNEVNLVGLWTDGQSPASSPGTDMSGDGINLQSGDVFQVRLAYNGATLAMEIRDLSLPDDIHYVQSFPINIPAIVGSDTAYVGFTGADGGLTSVQNLLSWSYTNSTATVGSGTYAWPVDFPAYTGVNDYSTYNGQYHTGLDLCPAAAGCVRGDPVYATANGTIQLVQVTSDSTQTMCDGSSTGSLTRESNNHLGNAIVIAHPDGKFSVYGHMDCIWPGIAPGVAVTQGQRIGNIGNSQYGTRQNSFTPHVHFEIKDAATFGDPKGAGFSGFTADLPDGYGYHDPRTYLFPSSSNSISSTAVRVVPGSMDVRAGPGTNYGYLTTLAQGQEFVAFATSGSWYEVYLPNAAGTMSGWIPANAGSVVLAAPDSSATKIQVGNTSGSGLLVRPSAGSSANLVNWVNNDGYMPFVTNCASNAKIWDGQIFVSAASQSGWYEYFLPGNILFSSASACGEPSGPGPSLGWSSASFLSVVP